MSETAYFDGFPIRKTVEQLSDKSLSTGCLGVDSCIELRGSETGTTSLPKKCIECLGAAGVDTSLHPDRIADGYKGEAA